MHSREMFSHGRRGCGEGHGFRRGMRGGSGPDFGAGWGDGERPRGMGRHRRGGGRLFDHGTLRWVVLSLIAEKPSHGYELIKAVEARLGGAYSPSPGVIYPSLTLLEEMGALESQADGGKKLYAITDTGRELLVENAAVLKAAGLTMDKFAARSARPTAIRDAVIRLRTVLHDRMTDETAMSEAQIQVIAGILTEAADQVEKV